MDLFTIGSDYLIEINKPDISSIKEFKTLIVRDKNRDKRKAKAELTFIYHNCSYKSPYANILNTKERRIAALTNSSLEEKDIDEEVNAAMNVYRGFIETRALKLINSGFIGISKLQEYFETVDLNATDANGKRIYSANELKGAIKDIGPMLESIKSLEEQLKKELSEESSIRGNAQKGFREDPR